MSGDEKVAALRVAGDRMRRGAARLMKAAERVERAQAAFLHAFDEASAAELGLAQDEAIKAATECNDARAEIAILLHVPAKEGLS